MKDEMLIPATLAQELHTSEASLAQHRSRGTGPKFIKAGRRDLYRRSDVNAWLDANTCTSTNDAGAA